jgi:hypothetical protein
MPASEDRVIAGGHWLTLFAALSAAPAARIGDVQILEVAQVLTLCAAALLAVRARFHVLLPPVWREYGGRYLALLCAAAAVSALSLRLPFYPPPDISLLKQPLAISLARLAELLLAMVSLLLVAGALGRSPKWRRAVLDVFAGVAILSACASILGWLLLKGAGVSTPLVYDFNDRVRGFFNEGGPYGMFLVAASLAVLLRAHLKPYVYRFQAPATLALFGVALLLSGSKAGLLAAAGLASFGVLVSGNRRHKLILIGAVVLVLAVLALFQRQLLAYWLLYQDIDEVAAYHPGDPNYVMGRVTGALIVPRMIAAHPIGGIGLGNYSLMRNDPLYLQGLPPVDEWDLTGMGLVGAMAELGIPLALCLFAILLKPLRTARKRKAASVVAVAAAFQPLSFVLGVNLNFFYPWMITAFALAAQQADLGAL